MLLFPANMAKDVRICYKQVLETLDDWLLEVSDYSKLVRIWDNCARTFQEDSEHWTTFLYAQDK